MKILDVINPERVLRRYSTKGMKIGAGLGAIRGLHQGFEVAQQGLPKYEIPVAFIESTISGAATGESGAALLAKHKMKKLYRQRADAIRGITALGLGGGGSILLLRKKTIDKKTKRT